MVPRAIACVGWQTSYRCAILTNAVARKFYIVNIFTEVLFNFSSLLYNSTSMVEEIALGGEVITDRVIALVGDLVGSREIPNRVAFDNNLLDTMKRRSELNGGILSPYTLIGDEIQAVYGSADDIFKDCMQILATVYPQRMRFAFGVGHLIKPINPVQAIEMDGPAFHHARDGVNELKKNGRLFVINGDGIPSLEIVRQALFLLSHEMDGWNKTRFQTLSMLLDECSVKEIAEKLDLSQQAIYKTINAGALHTVIDILKETATKLNVSCQS